MAFRRRSQDLEISGRLRIKLHSINTRQIVGRGDESTAVTIRFRLRQFAMKSKG